MKQTSIGISNISYYLPKKYKDLKTLQRENKIKSKPEQLQSLGFKGAKVADKESHIDLASKALKGIFKQGDVKPDDIDLLIYSGALPSSVTVGSIKTNSLDIFKYSASKLQYDFGLTKANVIGISQQGCVSLMSAIRLARDSILAEKEINTVLCVSSDVLPKDSKREIIYNIISDGACALVVKRNSNHYKILGYNQISKGYYWDPELKENELLASYFPTSKMVIEKGLEKMNLKLENIDWIIPHNVSMRSWDILLNMLKFPKSKFYGKNIALKGHTIAADNFINLKDAITEGLIKRGQRILLFTFGFGAHWSCLILEY